ncbi:MAG: pcnB3 [Chlamydiales bacterium]|jgi:poly(A) polymerase|nr:pcnB3 [Chlamydiales bacterium]
MDAAFLIANRLKNAGYTAYYAGGFVRDKILNIPSSDIDIATDASTEEIVALFPKTVTVGAQFGVVVVLEGDHSFEVATFRTDGIYANGRTPLSYERATPKEDASRRDFTINGLFYDPFEDKIIDYVGGVEDIKKKVVRAIGNPKERFREDRLRMLRAIRFACRLSYQIEPETAAAIRQFAPELFPAVSIERVVQELKKMASTPQFKAYLLSLKESGLLKEIFPQYPCPNLAEKDFTHLSLEAPLFIHLYYLFDYPPLKEMEALWAHLKLPKEEMKCVRIAALFSELYQKGALNRSHPDVELFVPLFADPSFAHSLPLLEVKHPEADIPSFQQELQEATLRQQQKHFIITPDWLKKEGLKPGPLFKTLIQQGEKIAIQHPQESVEHIQQRLKNTPLWTIR